MSLSQSMPIGASPLPGFGMPRGAASLSMAARTKLAGLIEAAERARDAARASSDRGMQAYSRLRRTESELEGLRHQVGADRLAAAAVTVSEARAAYERRQQLAAEASAIAGPLTQLAERLLAYVEAHATALQPAPDVTVKLGAVAPVVKLHETRLLVTQLQAKAAEVNNAPPTDKELSAAIRSSVDALAAAGQPHVGTSGELIWPTHRDQVWIDGLKAGTAITTNTPAILAWYDAPGLAARLTAEAVAARTATGAIPGLPRQERAEALRNLAARILDAERMEEALLCAMEERGSPLPRRVDADPRSVLGVVGPPPAQD